MNKEAWDRFTARRNRLTSHSSSRDSVWHWPWIGRRGDGVLDRGCESGNDDWLYCRIYGLVLSVLIRRRFLAWSIWSLGLSFSFATYQLPRKRYRNLRGFDGGERRAYN